MSLIKQIQDGESKIIELKERLPKNINIAKTVVAFSNTAGGKIIIGVNDRREITGIDDSKLFEIKDKIASIISDYCSPSILPEIYSVNIDGKLVLVIEVVRGNLKPYFLKSQGKAKGTYIRIGATNRLADLESINELERQKRHVSFDEIICYDTRLEELNLSPLTDRFKKMDKPLDPGKLQNLKLARTENNILYPTNALMIILGKFSHCAVKCARFKGKTMSVFIDKKEYTGDLFSILENTQNFILNHINLGAKINGLYREEIYEIPEIAIREALVNAIIHRDYVNRGRDIKVGVYDDVVNIVSPGSLPNNITMEDIFNGRSESRNRVIANIFKELGLIEQWGSGINRIINSCKEYGLPTPKIKEENDFMDIEIVRSQESLQSKTEEERSNTDGYGRLRTIMDDYGRLSPEKQKILLYLLDNGTINRSTASPLIKAKSSKTSEILAQLTEEDHLISRHGKGPGTYYTLRNK